jgi:hypothetical protein
MDFFHRPVKVLRKIPNCVENIERTFIANGIKTAQLKTGKGLEHMLLQRKKNTNVQ